MFKINIGLRRIFEFFVVLKKKFKLTIGLRLDFKHNI